MNAQAVAVDVADAAGKDRLDEWTTEEMVTTAVVLLSRVVL